MFSNFQRQMTYYGILDDVVDRYPWPNPIDLQSIRQQLITSAIYGKRILINDGYLVANPLLVPDIRDINRSLLGALLTSGIGRLFARDRNADLAKGILRTAERVSSHRKIVEDRQLWGRMEKELDFLSGEVRHRAVIWPHDKNMGHLFHILMSRVAALAGAARDRVIPRGLSADFDAIFRLYDDNIDKSTFDGARTIWEEFCWRHFSGRDVDPGALGAIRITKDRLARFPEYDRVKAMMNIANEIYHFAYAAGAAHSVRNAPAGTEGRYEVGVSSALIDVLPDLAGPEVVEGALSDAKVEAFNQLIISLPRDLEFGEDFSFVRSIQTDSEVREAGGNYLAALEGFANDQASHGQALKARDAYVDVLAELMAPSLRIRKRQFAYKSFGDLMVNVVTDAVKLTPVIGWALSTCLDHFRTRIIERMLVARVRASMVREGIHATQTRGAEPLVRTYGFYLGPLRQDGAAKLAGLVGPHPGVQAERELP